MIAKTGATTIVALQKSGGIVWMVRETLSGVIGRIAQGRPPFRLNHLFRKTNRVGPGSIPMVVMLSVFLGLTMALLTGYQLRIFGLVTLVPARSGPVEKC
ncbi:MAG: ABC transporter permease [Chthoniobacterales bacterium]|jgi:phospholipid/cholesterol/gamma-HCH transport system permease protein